MLKEYQRTKQPQKIFAAVLFTSWVGLVLSIDYLMRRAAPLKESARFFQRCFAFVKLFQILFFCISNWSKPTAYILRFSKHRPR